MAVRARQARIGSLWPAKAMLQTSTVFEGIGVASREFVFQKTATGGLLGDGRLSRPDFTLAAIRSWRFDPQRTLEVYSFEVKNRAGASVSAVYEAVAHGRFAHHPYLVCPRSRFDPAFNSEIFDACVREGIGLITFDIVVPIGRSFEVGAIQVVRQAARRSQTLNWWSDTSSADCAMKIARSYRPTPRGRRREWQGRQHRQPEGRRRQDNSDTRSRRHIRRRDGATL